MVECKLCGAELETDIDGSFYCDDHNLLKKDCIKNEKETDSGYWDALRLPKPVPFRVKIWWENQLNLGERNELLKNIPIEKRHLKIMQMYNTYCGENFVRKASERKLITKAEETKSIKEQAKARGRN